ncbi:DUF6056 family protein [Streptomyces sp. NPDC058231]|uniref:DUF6056 family protein n=1 Tax=Streptomyces sp. NPDC058231 TaxID=3346392 RepID=UPI0036EEEE0F
MTATGPAREAASRAAADLSRTTLPEQPRGQVLPVADGAAGTWSVPSWAGLWPAALCLAPLGLLGVAAWFGRWVRPSADEWCFLPVVRDQGLAGMIGKFYLGDNGRIANAVMVWAYAKPGVAGHQWFGLVSGTVMLGILWAVTASALRRAGLTAPRGVPLLVASMVTAVFLLATPNTYKTFYWPASSVSHTMAPVLACAAALPALRARSRTGRRAATAVVLLAGLCMGTLSEEASVVVIVVMSAVALLARPVFPGRRRAAVRVWCLAGIGGTGIGTLVLFTSPGARIRRGRFGTDGVSFLAPDPLLGALRDFGHILGTLLTTWAYLGAVAAGVLLGLLVRGGDGRRVTLPRRWPLFGGAGVLVFLLAGYLCTVVAYPVFGRSVVTSSRIWNDYLLLFLAVLVGAGALLGLALGRRARRSGAVRAAGAAVCAAVCAVVCVALTVPLGRLEGDMRVRAVAWERQDRWMRARAAAGARVLPYTPLPVAGMVEPFRHHGRRVWPNTCVADYYRLDRITYAPRVP